MSMATTAAVVGIAGTAYNMINGSNSGGGASAGSMGGMSPFVPGSADMFLANSQLRNEQADLYGQSQDLNSTLSPILQNSLTQELGIDQTPLINAGIQEGQQYTGLANLSSYLSGLFANQGAGDLSQQQALRGAGNSIYQTAFDPQQALFNQLTQQTTDQTRAADSARGLAMSPYSVGNESQALSNFDINWQNQQLQRSAGEVPR